MTEQPAILEQLGLDPACADAVAPELRDGQLLGRVASEHREMYTLMTSAGECRASLTGRFRFEAGKTEPFPSVGDWVLVSRTGEHGPFCIQRVLPRKTVLLRKVAGRQTRRQVIAANMDIVFVVHALDRTFNLRTLERYIVAARESDARTIVLLSKSDLCTPEDLEQKITSAAAVAPGLDVIPYSAVQGVMIEQIRCFLRQGDTGCFIGSSGVGKSTLINRLSGNDLLPVTAVRDVDAKGRHATTRRELLVLHGGGVVIDTPGLRELALWQGDEGIDATFEDVVALAAECRFRDCTHREEPGCAVLSALASGTLDQGRYTSYQKLRHEAEVVAERATVAGRLERKRREKTMGRLRKEVKRRKGR